MVLFSLMDVVDVVSVLLEGPVTVGAVVSTTKALLSAKELEAPGDARVRVALLPALSLIVPLLSASADVEV